MSEARDHTTQDIWQAIGEVRSAQASTEARLDSIEHSVETGFRTISTELQNLAGRVYAPPKEISPTAVVGASAAVIFGVLGLFGGYTMLITSPIKNSLGLIRETVDGRTHIIGEFEGVKAKLEHIEHDVRSLEAFKGEAEYIHGQREELSYRVTMLEQEMADSKRFEREAAYIHGQREELGKRVEDIDNQGSRRWNGKERPGAE